MSEPIDFHTQVRKQWNEFREKHLPKVELAALRDLHHAKARSYAQGVDDQLTMTAPRAFRKIWDACQDGRIALEIAEREEEKVRRRDHHAARAQAAERLIQWMDDNEGQPPQIEKGDHFPSEAPPWEYLEVAENILSLLDHRSLSTATDLLGAVDEHMGFEERRTYNWFRRQFPEVDTASIEDIREWAEDMIERHPNNTPNM